MTVFPRGSNPLTIFMNKITATRKLWFSAGHRVLGHENKCANLHGHNYTVYITVRLKQGNKLDAIGRVLDFGTIKHLIDPWIQSHWDHGMLIYDKDVELKRVFSREELNTHKLFICSFNPTAEEMASWLMDYCNTILLSTTGVEVSHIRLYETENCYADATL